MKRQSGKLASIIVLVALVCGQIGGIAPVNATEAQKDQIVDLVISLNVPEATTKITDDSIQLQALHVYADGHFTKVTQHLDWTSNNKNVASVSEDGEVHFLDHNGKTKVTVSDGRYQDQISFQMKPSGVEPELQLIQEKGERYDLVSRAVKGMTLEEKVGQMMMPDFRQYNGQYVTAMLPEIEAMIKKYHIGGVILFRENVVNTEQTVKLVQDYQKASEDNGLLITIDQEGGIVTRLQSGTDMPGNMALGATRSKELAYQTGDVIGGELAALGINTNFAPDMDVNNNPDNPVIGVRSFGSDPGLVADLGTAYIKGLQHNGIAATAKHFPGHGDTAVDSHLGLPEVPYDRDRLDKVELYPFRKAIQEGVDAIMTAHVTFPKIDDTKVISQKDGAEIALPATLSKKVITGLIREDLKFDGVISTDAMNMQAISDNFGPVDSAIRAIDAGVDIVLMPVGLEEVTTGVIKAVHEGRISESRIEESVHRLLALKVKRGIFKEETPTDLTDLIHHATAVVGSPEHKAVEAEAARKSVTLVQNKNQALPLRTEASKPVVVIGSTYVENLTDAITGQHSNTQMIKTTNGVLTPDQWNQLKNAEAVVIGSYTSTVNGRSPDNVLMKLYKQIIQDVDKPVIAVAIRNPYDIIAYTDVDAYLAQYGFSKASFTATAATIFGQNDPVGKLPVSIPSQDGGTMFDFGYGLGY